MEIRFIDFYMNFYFKAQVIITNCTGPVIVADVIYVCVLLLFAKLLSWKNSVKDWAKFQTWEKKSMIKVHQFISAELLNIGLHLLP